MPESPTLRTLQQRVDQLSRSSGRAQSDFVPLGHDGIDQILGGGLARARLHEIIATQSDDAASAAGFAAMCARRIGGSLAWLSVSSNSRPIYPHGLREIGLDPRQSLFVSAHDPPALLRAADDALHCRAIGTVVIDLWRQAKGIDLTVSRRLMLSAEAHGVTVLLLRVAVQPVPSAAQTRWSVAAAPSHRLAAGAPGHPMLDLTLLRQRGGPAGQRWRVEWDRDDAVFRAPLSGAVAAFSDRRSVAL